MDASVTSIPTDFLTLLPGMRPPAPLYRALRAAQDGAPAQNDGQIAENSPFGARWGDLDFDPLDAQSYIEDVGIAADTRAMVLSFLYALLAGGEKAPQPAAYVAYSSGIYAALALAGYLKPRVALDALLGAQGVIHRQGPSGCLIGVVGLEEAQLAEVLRRTPQLALSHINGPRHQILGHWGVDPQKIIQQLKALGALSAQRLPSAHAYHTRALDGALPALITLFEGLEWQRGAVPIFGLEGPLTPDGVAEAPRRVAKSIVNAVHWQAGLQAAIDRHHPTALLELSPTPMLLRWERARLRSRQAVEFNGIRQYWGGLAR